MVCWISRNFVVLRLAEVSSMQLIWNSIRWWCMYPLTLTFLSVVNDPAKSFYLWHVSRTSRGTDRAQLESQVDDSFISTSEQKQFRRMAAYFAVWEVPLVFGCSRQRLCVRVPGSAHTVILPFSRWHCTVMESASFIASHGSPRRFHLFIHGISLILSRSTL